MSLDGKVALITGAAQGIGLEIAKRLISEGAAVALVDMNRGALDRIASELMGAGAKVSTFVADVSKRDQVFAAVSDTVAKLGALDIMINNAGIATVNAITAITEEEIDKLYAVNTKGVLWGIQAATEAFRAAGTKGKIISASSIAGQEGFAMFGAYNTTKFAVRALTQAAAKELAPDGITVNAYCPGIVATDMWVEVDDEMAQKTDAEKGETFDAFVGTIALGRAQTARDVAGLVAFLSGPDSDYMTGQSIIMDGGMVYR